MSNNVRSALDPSRRWLIILVFHFLVVIIRLSVLPPPMRKPRGATPLYNARGGVRPSGVPQQPEIGPTLKVVKGMRAVSEKVGTVWT